MIKQVILFLCVFLPFTGTAQKLNFRTDGTFKIIQFTDTHVCAEKPESQTAVNNVATTLAAEKPDLVVFTGDVVTGRPAETGWKMILDPVAKSGIPFCVVLGNHDDEQDITRQHIARIVKSYPNNLNAIKNNLLDDFVLSVEGSTSTKAEALLYFFDSHAYSTIDTVKGYGWMTYEQVGWYKKTNAQMRAANSSKPLPALAFFHIPVPEYKEAYYNKSVKPTGGRNEDECSPQINTGMFAAFLEGGDVMGTFVGHDHNNDYVASLDGIALCYGRMSGGKTTYTNLPCGARIIELKEGQRAFDTRIRTDKGYEDEVSIHVPQQILYKAFSHNDYQQKQPLFDALNYGYNTVEADVHLIKKQLYVAHDLPKEISGLQTLEEQYLKPLSLLIKQNGGQVYPNSKEIFYLMIDFKSDAKNSYDVLAPLLEKYKDILCSVENDSLIKRPVLIFISGNRPFNSLEKLSLRRVFLDGRISDLDKNYSTLLMPFISNSYNDYFKWNGEDEMQDDEFKQLQSIISKTHKQGKKIRFWGAPHTDEFQLLMLNQGVDLIGEDHLDRLYQLLNGYQQLKSVD